MKTICRYNTFKTNVFKNRAGKIVLCRNWWYIANDGLNEADLEQSELLNLPSDDNRRYIDGIRIFTNWSIDNLKLCYSETSGWPTDILPFRHTPDDMKRFNTSKQIMKKYPELLSTYKIIQKLFKKESDIHIGSQAVQDYMAYTALEKI